MINRYEIKEKAKKIMQGNWNNLLLATLILLIVSALSGITTSSAVNINNAYYTISETTTFSGVFSLFVGSVIPVGACFFFLNLVKKGEGELNDFKRAFVPNYLNNFVTTLLVAILTVLWTLLFIIPGIIKGIAYSFTPYILAENPQIKTKEAIRLSMTLTNGKKGDIFVYYLSFFGWFLLGVLTCGIGMFYVIPYFQTTTALLYEELKSQAIEYGLVSPETFIPNVAE